MNNPIAKGIDAYFDREFKDAQDVVKRLRAHNDGVLCDDAANTIERLKAERDAMAEALRRISELTPRRANADYADEMHFSVKAIADAALTPAGRETPHD